MSEVVESIEGLTQADVCVIITCHTWDDEPYPRALRPGHSVCLVGKFGEGFDIRGPHLTACPTCLEPILSLRGDAVLMELQRHLSREHGISAPLLP